MTYSAIKISTGGEPLESLQLHLRPPVIEKEARIGVEVRRVAVIVRETHEEVDAWLTSRELVLFGECFRSCGNV